MPRANLRKFRIQPLHSVIGVPCPLSSPFKAFLLCPSTFFSLAALRASVYLLTFSGVVLRIAF